MKLKDFKLGNVLEMISGNFYVIANNDQIVELESGLIMICKHDDYDVTGCRRVYKDYTLKEVIWEREETPELTETEKHILLGLPAEYRTNGYITRNKYDAFCIHNMKPDKFENMWGTEIMNFGSAGACHYQLSIFNHLFNFVQWSDKEPWSIAELLEGEE